MNRFVRILYSTAKKSTWIPENIRPHKDKSLAELVNSALVFQMCRIPWLVEATPTLLETAQKLKLTAPMYFIVKKTFFRHFCGGEKLEEVLPTMKKFESNGIGSILDLAMEADIENAGELSVESAIKTADHVKNLMLSSLDIASHQDQSFIAVKVTAFVPPPVLVHWTNSLDLLKEKFDSFNRKSLSELEFNEFLSKLQYSNNEIFNEIKNKDNLVDWISVSEAFSVFGKHRNALKFSENCLNDMDFEIINATVSSLHDLCLKGQEKRVRIMIDAEQTYFQRAIDDVTLELSKKLNKTSPIVFNTYQMYLKDAFTRLKSDMERSERLGYTFGVKIVRGAYMISERERAEELKLPDPIHETIQDTHDSYNKAIDFLVEKLADFKANHPEKQLLSFVVASHNKDSAQKAAELVKEKGLSTNDGSVGFAQLMGMQDATTHFLAMNGFKSYKYIPYGPIQVTIPYLIRRAQENSSVLGGVAKDRALLVAELKKRILNLRTS